MNSMFVVRVAGVSALLAVIAQFAAIAIAIANAFNRARRSTSPTARNSWPLATSHPVRSGSCSRAPIPAIGGRPGEPRLWGTQVTVRR
jgi:hypothetical protein